MIFETNEEKVEKYEMRNSKNIYENKKKKKKPN